MKCYYHRRMSGIAFNHKIQILDRKLGPCEHLHSILKNKMATAKLGFEIYAFATIPERADVWDGPGGERGTSETPDLPGTVSKLMTCERKYAWLTPPFCFVSWSKVVLKTEQFEGKQLS